MLSEATLFNISLISVQELLLMTSMVGFHCSNSSGSILKLWLVLVGIFLAYYVVLVVEYHITLSGIFTKMLPIIIIISMLNVTL